jgi:hypothetical protein
MAILPLLKQKALAKDMSLPFARSLEGFNIRKQMQKNPLLKYLSALVTFRGIAYVTPSRCGVCSFIYVVLLNCSPLKLFL